MAEVENHFTVFIRLPFNRGNFVDPPPVSWSVAKERDLWDVISRQQGQGKGNEIDWHALAQQFEVTQAFILQQAAWLYERQLSQVRAQLRKVGNRTSNVPSPTPGSVSSSMMGGQAMKRAGSGGSRVPSRLSTQHVGSPAIGDESSTPPTSAKSRASLPLRAAPASTAPPRPSSGSSRPLSRQSSKEADPTQHSQSRRGSTQHQLLRSPKAVQTGGSESDEEPRQAKTTARRADPPSLHRRSLSLRKEPTPQSPKPALDEDEDDEDTPNFLPFAPDDSNAAANHPRQANAAMQDPGATLKGDLNPVSPQRPSTHRRTTSERITSPTKTAFGNPIARPNQPQNMSSSTSSLSSASNTKPVATAGSNRGNRPQNPNALSPRQQAALASAGLSPRRRAHGNGGSESSPSMGSSFSDLDDASVTQSALEEALISGMGNTTMTAAGGMASRVSGISQALRSRYFDARAQAPANQRESDR